MEKEQPESKKNNPIILQTEGIRISMDYRRGVGGDEGLTFDVMVADPKEAGERILRFDCFKKNPHYHVGPAHKDTVHNMKTEGIEDPLSWTLDQLKNRLASMITEAGYEEIARRIDQKAIAHDLSQLEKNILAKI